MGEPKQWVAFVDRAGHVEHHTEGPGAVSAARATPAGGVIIAGSQESGSLKGTNVVELDPSGHVIWSHEIKADVGGDEIMDVLVNDDGAIAVGVQNPIESGVSHGWIVALDAHGEPRWDKRLGEGSYHGLLGITAMLGGQFLAVGSKKKDRYGNWVATFDGAGASVHETFAPSDRWEGFAHVVAAPTGAFAVGISSAEQGDMRSVGKAFVALIAADGRTVWRKVVADKIAGVGVPVATKDGFAFLAASVDDPANARSGGALPSFVSAPRANASA